jgi:hypothetical protein
MLDWPPISRSRGANGPIWRIKWRGLTILLLVAGLTLWLLLALSAWLFVKYRRDFPDVRYADLVWPGRWPQYRVNQGNYYIAQADALLAREEYTLALHKLRVGVTKAPANAPGRLLLARVYLAFRRPDLAKEVLLGGLPHLAHDPAYLQASLGFLLEFHEDATLHEVTGQLLAGSADATTRPLAATFAATAAYYRGNYDEAEDLLGRHQLQDTVDGATLQARIAWDRGFPGLAVLRLKEHLGRHPRNDAARALLAGYFHSLGRIAEWESALVERVAADPLASGPRVAYLQLHHRRGDVDRLERETTEFLRQFGSEPAAQLLLADFAANAGLPSLARRVQLALAAHPQHAGAAALMVAEAHLVAGEYQPALDLITRYARDYPEWTTQFAPVFNGLQAVALTGLGRSDEARLSLDHLLAQKNLRADNLVAVAGRLSALGARELARSALARAVAADPLNQPALTSLIRLELDSADFADLPSHLTRFLRTRQPSREILALAQARLGSDRHLLLPGQPDLLAAVQAALNYRRP